MELPKRKNIRLKDYDYSQNGAYFITICVKDKHELLGHIDVGAIINRPHDIRHRPHDIRHCPHDIRHCPPLSESGIICENAIAEIPNHYPMVTVDKYVIMPNHVHMILFINNDDKDGRLIIAPTSISTIVQQMKRYVSKQIGFSMWQKSFHDHIIRNEAEYQKIWQYIDENPAKWRDDCYYKH